MPAKPVAPVAPQRASRAAPVPGVKAPAPAEPRPKAAAPAPVPGPLGAAAAGPLMAPVKPVTPAPDMEAHKDPEPVPEAPRQAPETDSSTREFDYLVTKLTPRLVVQRSKFLEDGKVFELKGGATIGRSPRSQIVLPDDYVSSTHARIFARKQFLFLEDLGSTNGTFIDGRRVEGEQQIKPGQEIVIGDTIFRYEE
ncbi:MAG: FHA domain-containing protein [Thermoleophilia bacterium]|nr:FHA domain-containing protein [Thermoleophilia bacterium]